MVKIVLFVIGLLLAAALTMIVLGAFGVIELKFSRSNMNMLLAVTVFSSIVTILTTARLRT